MLWGGGVKSIARCEPKKHALEAASDDTARTLVHISKAGNELLHPFNMAAFVIASHRTSGVCTMRISI